MHRDKILASTYRPYSQPMGLKEKEYLIIFLSVNALKFFKTEGDIVAFSEKHFSRQNSVYP